MPRRWTLQEEELYRKELFSLYSTKNLSIAEIAKHLNISDKTVFQRLRRLKIPTHPHKKSKYRNKRTDIQIPKCYSAELAELMGILLGDGCITHFQLQVTLGNKENSYAKYVRDLVEIVFNGSPKISIREGGYKTVYLGSTQVTDYLFKQGLVKNKVREQVDVPSWIFTKLKYQKHFLRGFFDTDGSVYKLKYGIQLNFCNYSKPILESLHLMLKRLEYSPSQVSHHKIYVTKRNEIDRFFREIQPQNQKHIAKYKSIKRVGTQAVNEDRL